MASRGGAAQSREWRAQANLVGPAGCQRGAAAFLNSTRRASQRMRRYRIGLLPVVWIVVGVVVAAIYDYFDSVSTVGQILTAIAAVLAWPLLFFGFDISIQRS
jgi:hypothetical protein